jgi:predicted nucleic acid-binding protein
MAVKPFSPSRVAAKVRTSSNPVAEIATSTPLVVLDSSCWIEYFRDSLRAELFAPVADYPDQLVVPVVTIYEVTKKMRRELDASIAAFAESVMCRGRVIDIDITVTRRATTLALPLADSLIYATAQLHDATLWTQDAHFEGLPGVKYFAKAP